MGCNKRLAGAYVMGTRYERISDWTVVGLEVHIHIYIFQVDLLIPKNLQILTVMVAGLLAITLQNAERRRLYR